jgi:hypothetical protein
MVLGFAKAKMWPQARASADEMRQSSRQELSSLRHLSMRDSPLATCGTGRMRRISLTPPSRRFQTPSRSHRHNSNLPGYSTRAAIFHFHRRCSLTTSPVCRQGHDQPRQGRVLGGTRLGASRQGPRGVRSV